MSRQHNSSRGKGSKEPAKGQKDWEKMFALLKKYKNAYGHASPEPKESFRSTQLGSWCANQRLLFTWKRKGLEVGNQLTGEMISRLNSIGFRWEKPTSTMTAAAESLNDARKPRAIEKKAPRAESPAGSHRENEGSLNNEEAKSSPASDEKKRKATARKSRTMSTSSAETKPQVEAAPSASSLLPSQLATQPIDVAPSIAAAFALPTPSQETLVQVREQELRIQQQLFEQEQIRVLAAAEQRRRRELERQVTMMETQLQANALQQRLEQRAHALDQMELDILRRQQPTFPGSQQLMHPGNPSFHGSPLTTLPQLGQIPVLGDLRSSMMGMTPRNPTILLPTAHLASSLAPPPTGIVPLLTDQSLVGNTQRIIANPYATMGLEPVNRPVADNDESDPESRQKKKRKKRSSSSATATGGKRNRSPGANEEDSEGQAG